METTLNKQARVYLSSKTKETIIDFVCYALIILFVYTASSKIFTYSIFEQGLHHSVLLVKFSHILAWLIPSSEIIISALLMVPKTRKYGLVSSLMLLIIFTLYLIYMISYGGPKSCGCGGVIEALSWTQHIFFNIVFIILNAVAVMFIYRKFK